MPDWHAGNQRTFQFEASWHNGVERVKIYIAANDWMSLWLRQNTSFLSRSSVDGLTREKKELYKQNFNGSGIQNGLAFTRFYNVRERSQGLKYVVNRQLTVPA